MYEELLDSISEDDKDSYEDLFNEDNTAFNPANVAKQAKAFLKIQKSYDEETFECKIISL